MPRLFRLTLGRLFLGVAVIALVGLLFWMVGSNPWRDPFRDKYQAIHYGMTEQDVEEILGPPSFDDSEIDTLSSTTYSWVDGHCRIDVTIYVTGVGPGNVKLGVVGKHFYPTSWWEWLQSKIAEFRR